MRIHAVTRVAFLMAAVTLTIAAGVSATFGRVTAPSANPAWTPADLPEVPRQVVSVREQVREGSAARLGEEGPRDPGPPLVALQAAGGTPAGW